jgi:hypothetical protein
MRQACWQSLQELLRSPALHDEITPWRYRRWGGVQRREKGRGVGGADFPSITRQDEDLSLRPFWRDVDSQPGVS